MIFKSLNARLFWNLFTEVLVVLAFSGILVWVFQSVLRGETHLLGAGDTADALYTHFVFLSKSLKSGTLPLWDPHLFGGFPMVAYPLIGIFYPLHWLFWLWPYQNGHFPPEAYTYLVSFHIVLSGYTTYRLGRGLSISRAVSLLMGIVYMLSPNILLATAWSVQINSAPWFPLILLGLLKFHETHGLKYIVLTVFALSTLVLSAPAHPAIIAIFLVGGFAFFSLIWKLVEDRKFTPELFRMTAGYFVIITLSMMIGSISLLPAAELSARSIRFLGEEGHVIPGESMMPHVFARYVMEPQDLLGLILPSFMGSGMGLYFFGVITFMIGMLGLVLPVKQKFAKYVAVAIVLSSTIYSLRLLPLELIYRIPILNLVREPEKFLMMSTLGMTLLFGVSLEGLLNPKNYLQTQTIKLPKLLLLTFATYALTVLIAWRVNYDSWIKPLVLPAVFILGIFLWNRFLKRRLLRAGVLFCFAILLIVDMRQFINQEFSFSEFDYKSYFSSQQELTQFVPTSGDFYRVAPIESEKHWPYQINLADSIGFYDTWGYGNPINWRYVEYKFRNRYCDRIYDLLSVRYFITHESSKLRLFSDCGHDVRFVKELEEIQHIDWTAKPVNDSSRVQIYENINVLPYARLLTQVEPVESGQNSLQLVTDSIDIDTQAVVDGRSNYSELSDFLDNKSRYGAASSVRLQEYGTNMIKLDVEASEAAILVLGDPYYPGWKARVDGQQTKVYEINRMFRGIPVPPGSHNIEVYFLPDILLKSFGLLTASVLGCIILLVFGKRPSTQRRNILMLICTIIAACGCIYFFQLYSEASYYPPILKP